MIEFAEPYQRNLPNVARILQAHKSEGGFDPSVLDYEPATVMTAEGFCVCRLWVRHEDSDEVEGLDILTMDMQAARDVGIGGHPPAHEYFRQLQELPADPEEWTPAEGQHCEEILAKSRHLFLLALDAEFTRTPQTNPGELVSQQTMERSLYICARTLAAGVLLDAGGQIVLMPEFPQFHIEDFEELVWPRVYECLDGNVFRAHPLDRGCYIHNLTLQDHAMDAYMGRADAGFPVSKNRINPDDQTKTMKSQLQLLPLTNDVVATEVLAAAPTGRLYACDFAVTGAQLWTEKPWGYENERIVNIDHHAPTPLMRNRISSTNLAILYVREQGIARADETVVINHTDCDSILSSAIMRGDLKPLEIFGAAAIAADHTGKENPIADLLQALDKKRDYECSLRNLRLLIQGNALDEGARAALEVRHTKRAKAAELVQSGAFTMQDGVAWAEIGDALDGEFFPALLPDASLIAMFIPREGETAKWNAKFRLGSAAASGFSLPDAIAPIDAGYGGRWNAGSNTRSHGSSLTPQQYVAALTQNLRKSATHLNKDNGAS